MPPTSSSSSSASSASSVPADGPARKRVRVNEDQTATETKTKTDSTSRGTESEKGLTFLLAWLRNSFIQNQGSITHLSAYLWLSWLQQRPQPSTLAATMQFFMSRAQDLLDTYERAIGDRIKDAATKKRAELEAQRKLGQRWARRARQTGHMTDLEVIIAEENQAAMEVCLATQTSRLIALAKDKSIILLDLQSQMDLLHKFRQEDATAPTRSFEDTLRRWIQTKNSHPSPQSSLIVPSNLMSSHKCGHSPCDPSADQVSCIKLRISSIGAPNFWECRECCAVAFKAFLGAVPQALRFNSHNPVSFTDSICGFNHCSQPVDAKASTIFWGNSRHGIMTKQCIECSGDLEKPRWQLQPCDGCGRELKRAILLPMEYVACLPCLDEAMKCKVLGAPNYIDFETARQASLR